MASGGARPGAGRRRKDPALKALSGTDRKDRDVVPVPIGDAASAPMVAPMYLTDHEQLLFGSIAQVLEEQKRANPHFAEHVALLAVRLSQMQRLKAVLEIEGDTFRSRTVKKINGKDVEFELIRARPEVAMMSEAMRQAQSLLGELMLNPSSALRIASGHKPEAGAFDDF